MNYFCKSICIINLIIIFFNLMKLAKYFILLKSNFKNSHISLWSFLKDPDRVYDRALTKMDELESVLGDLIQTVNNSENLILLIDSMHSKIKAELIELDNLNLLDQSLKNRYDGLNNIFNQIFDRSQINIEESYQIMDRALEYLKRG